MVLDSFKDPYLEDVSCGLQAGFEQIAPINPPSHTKLPNSDLVLLRFKGMKPHSAFLGQLSGSRPRTPNCLSSTSKMTESTGHPRSLNVSHTHCRSTGEKRISESIKLCFHWFLGEAKCPEVSSYSYPPSPQRAELPELARLRAAGQELDWEWRVGTPAPRGRKLVQIPAQRREDLSFSLPLMPAGRAITTLQV